LIFSFLESGATVSTGWAPPKQTWFKSAKGQYLLLPQSSFCSVCQSTQPEWHTHIWTQYDHRTLLQHLNGHVVDISHKDNNNTMHNNFCSRTQSQQSPAHRARHRQTGRLELLQDSAPKDDFLENSRGNQTSILLPPITPEEQPLSPDTLSLSPTSPLLCFSEKMEKTGVCWNQTIPLFCCKPPDVNLRKSPKPVGPAPTPAPPPVKALRTLPQLQDSHPPPSSQGEPKTTDTSSQ